MGKRNRYLECNEEVHERECTSVLLSGTSVGAGVPCFNRLIEPEVDSVLHSPLLQRDVVGVVASFLAVCRHTVVDLRRIFILVCRLWFEAGMEIVKGMEKVSFRNL